jgi:uncharacterized protein YutE (UPF0331/DUF86 family)
MRKGDKINQVKEYLEELNQIIPDNLKDYLSNFEKRAACEHYFEKIIEAVIDLCFIIIKEKKLELPEEDKNALDILGKNSILSDSLVKRLREAKGMRNIIAHQYGDLDNELIFDSLKNEIIDDVNEFLKQIS